MNRRSGSRNSYDLARVGIFLIIAALIAGIAGCTGGGGVECQLTITSTAGGSVTGPGEGIFTYPAGEGR
jgi:hypothetical protein